MSDIRVSLNFEHILPLGKYRGQLVGKICDEDPHYLYWMINNTDVKFHPEVIKYVTSEVNE